MPKAPTKSAASSKSSPSKSSPSSKVSTKIHDQKLSRGNGGEYGDASLPIGKGEVRMGPTSTIAGVFILNALLAEAVDKLMERGVAVDVYQSANMQGGEAAAEAMLRRWQSRIRGL